MSTELNTQNTQITGPAATNNPDLILRAEMNELYQSNYVNGRDIDRMFALYRKVQVNVLGVTPSQPESRYVDAEEPSTPTLQRYSKINQSIRLSSGSPLAIVPGTTQAHQVSIDRPNDRPSRKILKFEPCGSPIDEMSGEEDRHGNNNHMSHNIDRPKPRSPSAGAKFTFPEIPPDQWEPEEKFPPPPEHVLLDHYDSADTNSLPWNLKYSEREKRRNKINKSDHTARPGDLHIIRDDNWVLRERLPALEASVINRSGVTVTSPNKPANRHMSGMYKQFIELHKSPIFYGSADGLNRDRFMTYGRLRLFKTNSTGRHSSSSDDCASDYSSWGKNSTVRLSNGGSSSVSSRSSSNSVPDDPLQRSLNQTGNSRIHVCEVFNREKSPKDDLALPPPSIMNGNWILSTPELIDSRIDEGFSPTDSQISSLPTPDAIPEIFISRADTLSVDSSSSTQTGGVSIEKILKTNADIIRSKMKEQKRSSQDDTTSLNNNVGTIKIDIENNNSGGIGRFSSCPDLKNQYIGDVGEVGNGNKASNDERKSRMRKFSGTSAGGKRGAAPARPTPAPWREKPLKRWELDDIMGWLQHIGLNEVASLLVGYEITGEDVKQWDAETMTNLGIAPSAQTTVLNELRNLKRIHSRCSSRRSSPIRSLFPLLTAYGSTQLHASSHRSASPLEESPPTADPGSRSKVTATVVQHQILALTIPALPNIKAAGFTIAEGQSGGLVVTRVSSNEDHNSMVIKGDCILEINGHSALNMAAVDFNCLLSATEPNRLVLVRQLSPTLDSSGYPTDMISPTSFPANHNQGGGGSSNRTSISSYPDIDFLPPSNLDFSPGSSSSATSSSGPGEENRNNPVSPHENRSNPVSAHENRNHPVVYAQPPIERTTTKGPPPLGHQNNHLPELTLGGETPPTHITFGKAHDLPTIRESRVVPQSNSTCELVLSTGLPTPRTDDFGVMHF